MTVTCHSGGYLAELMARPTRPGLAERWCFGEVGFACAERWCSGEVGFACAEGQCRRWDSNPHALADTRFCCAYHPTMMKSGASAIPPLRQSNSQCSAPAGRVKVAPEDTTKRVWPRE